MTTNVRKKSNKTLTREEELILKNERLRTEIPNDLILARKKTKIIEKLRRKFDYTVLLDCISITRSSFYYHQKCFKKKDKYSEIKTLIKKVFHRHKGKFGNKRITLLLKEKENIINHETVLRLMKILKLKSVIRVKKNRSYRGEHTISWRGTLRQINPTENGRLMWPEFNVSGNKLYFSPIIYLYNG